MIVDGVELLRMVKENRFEDGDKIIAEITKHQEYIYSSYCSNFLNKNTGKELSVTDYIFWTFIILSEEDEEIEIDIDSIQELEEKIAYTNIDIVKKWNTSELIIVKQQNKILKAVKQLNRKIKGE